ncbi:LD-carboxypeptidase [Parasalinivibrio latis]|uniref:S66 peptidase family protein n=1 Tax=Parasalinivibrio latis TaxID=2952610 RepID=UPI0030E1BC5E
MLKPNDKVALISPASQLPAANRQLIEKAVDLLERWGLRVELLLSLEHHFYLAGDDSIRSANLNHVLQDPEIKAVFCSRGGYGCARIVGNLPVSGDVSEKVFVGYSDISTLHLAFAKNYPQVHSIHGPNLVTGQFLDDTEEAERNRHSLRSVLFSNNPQIHDVEFIRNGKASGRLVGGCLSMVASAAGTPDLPDMNGAILFLEDVGERPYKIDRMIQQLKNAGMIENLSGIVFGAMHDCSDPYNDLKAVILDAIGDKNIPIAFGLESGHGPVNLSIRMNGKATLDSMTGKLIIE